jgi:hypothetical protein
MISIDHGETRINGSSAEVIADLCCLFESLASNGKLPIVVLALDVWHDTLVQKGKEKAKTVREAAEVIRSLTPEQMEALRRQMEE